MLVKTSVDLTTSNLTRIKANTQASLPEMMFNTVSFHADKGSVIVFTEYGKREIHTFGNLQVKESDECDTDGMKIILVS